MLLASWGGDACERTHPPTSTAGHSRHKRRRPTPRCCIARLLVVTLLHTFHCHAPSYRNLNHSASLYFSGPGDYGQLLGAGWDEPVRSNSHQWSHGHTTRSCVCTEISGLLVGVPRLWVRCISTP